MGLNVVNLELLWKQNNIIKNITLKMFQSKTINL